MKKPPRVLSLLLATVITVSLLVLAASATNFTNYTTYDATSDFSGARTWAHTAGNLKITANFTPGNLTSKDYMDTSVSTSNWDTNYTVTARCHIQTTGSSYYESYGDTTSSASSCELQAGLWEHAQFAMHYGIFKDTAIDKTYSRYFKGMYYYEDGVGRSINSVPDEGILPSAD